MSNGGYKGASPARETSPEQYPGVWELTEQFQAQADGNWPFQAADCAPKSLRFDSSSNAYLSKTPFAAGNRRVWTLSWWMKLGKLGANYGLFGMPGTSSGQPQFYSRIGADNKLYVYDYNPSGTYQFIKRTEAILIDPSAWYHCIFQYDSTQSTAEDGFKIYVNSERITSWSHNNLTNYQQNYEGPWNSVANTGVHIIGQSDGYFDGYLADIHFIDGQALEPIDFGFYDGQGIWQPKRFTGDYSSGPVYSNYLTSSGGFASATEGPDKAFDGIADTTSRVKATQDDILTFDISSFGFTGLFELWSQNSGAEFSIDGGSNWSAIGNNAWTTVSSDISGVSTIQMRPSPGARMKVSAFRSQGQLLFDALVGRNSFHLDFSDTSSDAALGKDVSGLENDWTPNNLVASSGGNVPVNSITFTGNSNSGNSMRAFYIGSTVVTSSVYATATNSISQYDSGQNSGSFPNAHDGDEGTNLDWKFGNIAYTFTGKSGPYVEWIGAISSGGSVTINGTTYNAPFTQTGTSAGNRAIYRINLGATAREVDSFFDSPVNGNEASTGAGGQRRGNYACMNPLNKGHSQVTLSNGNLDVSVGSNASAGTKCQSTIGMSSGKYYCEFTCVSGSHNPGLASTATNPYSNFLGDDAGSWTYGANGKKYHNDPSAVGVNYGASYAAGDVIGVAFDADAGTLTFYKNGASQGVAYSGLLSGPYFFATGGSNSSLSANFGQRSFEHPLSTHSPLATSFLPEPTIKRGDEGFDTALWQGNGGVQTIGNLRLNPGLVWIKSRDDAYGSALYDQVRGANLRLRTDDQGGTNPDQTQTNGLSAFTEDGFTLGSHNAINESPDDYVGWIWGGGETTTTISPGDLNSSVYATGRKWSNDLSATNLASPGLMFDWTYGYGTYTGTCTWTTTNAAYSNLSGRVRLANNTTVTLGITFKDSNGATLGTFNLPWTGNGQQMQDTGFDWSSSVASVEITGGYLPVRVHIGDNILVDAFNDSQTWSGNISTTGNSGTFHSSYPATHAFNNNDANYAHGNGDGSQTAVVTLTLSPGVSCSNTVSFLGGMTGSGTATISVNGGTAVNLTSGSSATTKTDVSFTGTVTSIVVTKTSSDASGMLIYGFEIDGARLVDNGVSVVTNVPSIATNVRANPSTGFSIMTLTFPVYSGTSSVAHGLNSAPHFWMMKDRDSQDGWYLGHKSMGGGNYFRLESNAAKVPSTYLWDNKLPDSNVIYNNGTSMSGSGSYLMLAWAPVDGYSAFGSYTGNNLSDGPFVYTGFKPAWVMIKGDNSSDWLIVDSTRDPINVISPYLAANRAYVENGGGAWDWMDFLSNGFKQRNNGSWHNSSNTTYYYFAFAEHPFASNCRAF